MTKHNLDNDFDYTFTLFGIVCHDSEYKICSGLSKQLNIDFVREKSIELKGKKKDEYFHFSLFGFKDELSGNSYYLLNNSSSNALEITTNKRSNLQPDLFESTKEAINRSKGKLIPELQEVDYFLLLDGEFSNSELLSLNQKIQETEIVVTCRMIEVDRLSSKNNLIF